MLAQPGQCTQKDTAYMLAAITDPAPPAGASALGAAIMPAASADAPVANFMAMLASVLDSQARPPATDTSPAITVRLTNDTAPAKSTVETPQPSDSVTAAQSPSVIFAQQSTPPTALDMSAVPDASG